MATPSVPSASTVVIRRLRQAAAVLSRPEVDESAAIRGAQLTPDLAAAFRSLPAFDRRHLCRVYETMRLSGTSDPDLLQAALLHDLGKCEGNARVLFVHRTLRVVLDRLAPGLLHRLAALPAQRWRFGIALAVHHPHLGAVRAARLGCSSRACWLIAHHEDRHALDDPDLARLIAVDEQTP
jgi:hypothetical protein